MAAWATGGFNFDAKLRRQSIDRNDLFHAHIGGIDTLARALLVAADMIEAGTLASMVERPLRRLVAARLGHRSWPGRCRSPTLPIGSESGEIDPSPASGQQELYENVVNSHHWRVG